MSFTGSEKGKKMEADIQTMIDMLETADISDTLDFYGRIFFIEQTIRIWRFNIFVDLKRKGIKIFPYTEKKGGTTILRFRYEPYVEEENENG